MIQSASTSLVDDVVDVTVPADGGWLGILRTATAGLAAGLGFAGDKIEDLRIAVDEACAMLLVITPPDGDLRCRFEISPDELACGDLGRDASRHSPARSVVLRRGVCSAGSHPR
jgi:serine/threonine-protein kinase RsbW